MKKIFSLFVAALFCASMFADKIYFKAEQDWWNWDYSSRTVAGAYAWGEGVEANAGWPGVLMTKVEGEDFVWEIELDAKYTKVIFTRCASNGEHKGLKTVDLDIPTDGNNLYTMTCEEFSWDNVPANGIAEGEWSVYVTETPADPKVEIAGDFNGWTVTALELAEDKLSASITLNLELGAHGGTSFKMIENDNWVTKQAGSFTLKRDLPGVAGVNFAGGENDNFWLEMDMAGEYTFTWTFANDSIGITFPELPELTLEDGYYAIGLNGWSIYGLDASLKFAANTEAEGEWVLKNVTLIEGQSFKVVSVENKELKIWYGMGKEGNDNYSVTSEVAGVRDIYFRPGDDAPESWNGHIYVNWGAPTAVENTAVEAKVVKMIENGQLVIIKGDMKFNAQGQIVK